MGPRNGALGAADACELLVGPRDAVLGVADAWGAPPLGPLVEPTMGPRNAELGVAGACGHPPLGLRWSSHGAKKRCT
eukprot:1805073-Pyramimonas_sp.AAC.1